MHHATRRVLLALLAVTLMGSVATMAAGKGRGDHRGGALASVYTLPGDAVYPEGIALDRRSGTFYVSATSDGTIYRGNVRSPALTPFAAGGADGRTMATGMTLDGRGRLFVAGAGTGKAWVLSTRDGSTIKALDSQPGSSPTFVNDVALGRGYAYFTDSLRPVILRVSRNRGAIGELEPWLDLTGTPFAYEAGFNANGIVSLRGGRLLVVVQANTGKLFRIDTRSREVSQIDLGGVTLTNGDGLVLGGHRLYVLRNAQEQIVEVKLRGDARSASVGRTLTSDALMFPTTAALDRRGRLLVVNAQFDKRPTGNPVLPFTVAALPLR